jgi:hypothetical protein
MHRLAIALVAAIWLSSQLSVDAQEAPSLNITVTVYNCFEELATVPDVSVASAEPYTDFHSLSGGVVRKREPGVYEISFPAVAVHSWARVRVGRCVVRVPITVLPGHRRNILVFPTYMGTRVIDARQWVAGTLPQGVGSVRLLTKSSTPLGFPTIDDGCYYLEFAPTGDFSMSFSVSPGGPSVNLPVSLPSGESGKILNLTEKDIVEALVRTHAWTPPPQPFHP